MTTAPTASILGGPDFYVQKGSTINLTCTIRLAPDESPAFIFWYHEDEVKIWISKNFLVFHFIAHNTQMKKKIKLLIFIDLSFLLLLWCYIIIKYTCTYKYLGDKLWQQRRYLNWNTKGWFNNITSPHTECRWNKFGQIQLLTIKCHCGKHTSSRFKR